MRFGRLIVLMLALLLMQQAQCLAACAVETCEQGLPPCHRHHDDSSKDSSQSSSNDAAARCSHDAVTPTVVQFAAVDGTPMEMAELPELRAVTDLGPAVTITASPPGPSFSILRI
ncbi:MAG TPA: hypothetical protein VGN17_11535 [Bryobacteraceae bacterium]|jgi:hypothetical protein